MDADRLKRYKKIKEQGLTPERHRKILSELNDDGTHDVEDTSAAGRSRRMSNNIYAHHDQGALMGVTALSGNYHTNLRSLDELLERDKKREEDGFPKKIRVGRLVKPGKGGKNKVVVVPTTVEEKFLHDSIRDPEEGGQSGGTGEGEEGEVIGEESVREADGSGAGPGEGESGPHEMESNAYDLGKILTEKFQLPNLKDRGKKRSLTRYTYDLTDKHRGFGQLLDKKATLREIVETNIHLGNLPDVSDIDPTRFVISPRDKIYRVLSREVDYESQAMVFFLRDYSGSMVGKATGLVVTQHVLIYSWLLYQYAMQVETRFILHDTSAKEVPDFYTYYNSKVAGGTQVSSAFQLVNEIVDKENLVADYNIYVFHGTDGDDWDNDGEETIPQLRKMLTYANRVGITIAQHASAGNSQTEVERYLDRSELLTQKKDLLRLDAMPEDADESRMMEGIKKLISP